MVYYFKSVKIFCLNNYMKAQFLSYYINSNTPVYGGYKGVIQISKINSIENGDNSNNLSANMPLHVGTHIDFPFHFSNIGKKINDYPASFWIFEKVGFLNCSIENVVNQIDLLSTDIEILILKTGFGENRNNDLYWSEQPIIPAEYANLFRDKFPQLRVFGFDLISLTSKLNRNEGKLAHINFLLNNEILILEDMNLQELDIAPNKIIVAPLQISNADGVPCNVFAF